MAEPLLAGRKRRAAPGWLVRVTTGSIDGRSSGSSGDGSSNSGSGYGSGDGSGDGSGVTGAGTGDPGGAPFGSNGSGSGLGASMRGALLRHPLAAAGLYMALGGLLVYVMLGVSAARGAGGLAVQLDPPAAMSAATAAAVAAAAHAHAPAAAAAASRRAEEAALCDNTCPTARDGVCDDGRRSPNATAGGAALEAWVRCDLGTDCDDCGPWRGRAHGPGWNESVGPIAFLRERGIEVRVRQTVFAPRFWFAYTDPRHDVDVSASMAATGVVEQSISHIFYHVLHKPCAIDGAGLFVDVGGNFGWYSVFSAMLGCAVVAFEPVPQFRAFFEYNLARNGLTHLVQVRPTVAVRYPGRGNYTVVVPKRGIWGTAGIDGANIDAGIDNEGAYEVLAASGEALDEVLGPAHVDLLKVDVEGFEPDVLAGAARLLSSGAVDNVVMEYSPHVAEKARSYADLPRAPRMLLSLLRPPANFSIGHIEHRGPAGDLAGWSQALGLFPAVTESALRYDLLDAKLLTKEGAMWAREPCAEAVARRLVIDGIPERYHPKSFRSVINFNTNVWATRLARFRPHLQGPQVGVLPARVSVRDSWFPPPPEEGGSDLGMGGRSCAGLQELAARDNLTEADRASLLVSHHCRCAADAPCRAAEVLIEACVRRGEIPFED